MQKLFLLSILSAAAASAQAISVGVMAGVPVLDLTSSKTINAVQYDPQSLHYTVGGAFQLDLPFQIRLEIDALYRPASFSVSSQVNDVTAAHWRFPVMGKYRFKNKIGGGHLEPFAGAGFSFDHLYQVSNAVTSGPGSIVSNSPGGVVLVGGVDFKAFGKRLSAEGRYTRQANDTIQSISQLNNVDFLLGFHF
jgi:hypothetical protein